MIIFNGFMNGVNLGGWLSQCEHTKEHYDSFITEEDIACIASWGLDHVRIPFDNELIEDESGKFLNEGFTHIEHCIEWCKKYSLNIILDLHKTTGYTFNNAGTVNNNLFSNETLKERFVRIWDEVSRRYSYLGQNIAFELLNEVVEDEYCDEWNRLSEKAVTAIRKYSDDVKIIIGGVRWNSVRSIPLLSPPYDKNIVYNFHCYEPLIFTHQRAYWMETMPPQQYTNYPASIGTLKKATSVLGEGYTDIFEDCEDSEEINVNFFEKIFKPAVDIAQKYGIALYCGEYGVIDRAPADDMLRWYKDIVDAFEHYGIGRAAWNYKGLDFGLNQNGIHDRIFKITV